MEVRGTGNGDSIRLGRTFISVRDLQVARLQVDVRGRRHLYDAGNRLSILESLGAVGHVQRRVDPRAQRADDVPGSRRPVDGAAKRLRHRPGRPRPDAGNRASQLSGVRSPATQRRAAHTCAHGTSTSSSAPSMHRIREGSARRFIANPMLQFVADGSYVHYRATGATRSSRTIRTWRARTCCCRADGFRSTRHASPLVICPC